MKFRILETERKRQSLIGGTNNTTRSVPRYFVERRNRNISVWKNESIGGVHFHDRNCDTYYIVLCVRATS